MYSSGDLVRDKYRIKEKLSEHDGIYSYRADAGETGDVVFNCLSLSSIAGWSSVQAFERKVAVLRRVEHPGIPRFIEYFEDESGTDSLYCIVRRYIAGSTLDELRILAPGQRDTVALEAFMRILNVLAALHAFNPPVIHGNIGPDHILRTENGNVYLLGLGNEAPDNDILDSREKPREDIRDLALTILSFLFGKPKDELARLNPYEAGLVPQPRNRLERVLFLAVRADEHGGVRSARELASLLSGPDTGDTGSAGRSSSYDRRPVSHGTPVKYPASPHRLHPAAVRILASISTGTVR